MKIENVFAVILTVLATGLAVSGQTPSLAPGTTPPPAGTAPAPVAPAPEPLPPPLPEGRTVSYAPITGTELGASNAPANDDVVDVVAFDGVPLTDAVRTLALQAGLNTQFDPNLLMGPDGQPRNPPPVTEHWKKLTAMQALHALLDNWGWQIVWDPLTRVARVTKKDANAKEPLIVDVVALRYANPTNVLREVEGTLSSGSAIVADMRTHQLIVRTTERERQGIEQLITRLDTPTREVLVEARIISTSKDINSAKGVDWTGTLAAQHVSFGNGITAGQLVNTSTTTGSTVPSGTTTSPSGAPIATGPFSASTNATSLVNTLTTTISGSTANGGGFSANTAHGISPATAFLNADGVQAVLSFLNTDNDSKIIAFPRTVALDGVPTELAVVQNVPIFQQTQSAPASGASQGLATIQPNYSLSVDGTILNEVGVKLLVTPRIAGPTNILLDLKPEISQQGATVTETLNGQANQAPSFTRSRIFTQAAVPSGYTLVLGGMDQDSVTKVATKVPFFGDIPGLGNLFRSDSKDHTSQTVLIFVTPTIITDEDFQTGNSQFLKRRPTAPSGGPDSAWDSAEPYDWTKPKPKVNPEYQP